MPRKAAASNESLRVAGGEGVITRCVGGPSLFVVANMGGGPPQPAVSGDPVGATTWYARGPQREGHGLRAAEPAGGSDHSAVVEMTALIRRVIAPRVHDRQLVDDLVQEALTRVMSARQRLEPDALAPYRRRTSSLTVVDGDSVGRASISLRFDSTHFVTPGFNSGPDVITNFTRALKPFLLRPDER